MGMTRKHPNLVSLMRLIIDLSSISAAFLFAIIIKLPADKALTEALLNYAVYWAIFSFVWFVVAKNERLFVSRRGETLVAFLLSLARAYLMALFYSGFLAALFIESGIDRPFFFLFASIVFAAILLPRIVLRLSLWNLRRRGFNFRRILVIGCNKRTVHLMEILRANEQYGYHVEGFLDDEHEREEILKTFGVPWLGPIRELENLLANHVIDIVYVSLPIRSHYETIQSVANLCEGVGVPVRLAANLFPVSLSASDIMLIRDIPVMSLFFESEARVRFTFSRVTDIVAAALLFVTLLPAFVVIAILVKVDSRGPVFVVREHMRTKSKSLKVLSFRVTCQDKKETDDTDGKRLSRIGRLLVRYGLNELPLIVSLMSGHIRLSQGRITIDRDRVLSGTGGH